MTGALEACESARDRVARWALKEEAIPFPPRRFEAEWLNEKWARSGVDCVYRVPCSENVGFCG